MLYPSAPPGEGRLDPARGSWAVFMQMAAGGGRGLIPPSPPSFIPGDTRALTVKPHLLFSEAVLTHIHRISLARVFLDDEPNMLLFVTERKCSC